MKTTVYFLHKLQERGLEPGWCEAVVAAPLAREVQHDGRIRYWGEVPGTGKILRVVLLSDGETFHNAFFDRNFAKRVNP